MATTVKLVNELFRETIDIVSQDAEHWQSFLKTASMNYTNSFSEQLLIYAQRPSAVACTDIDTWNNTYKRYVNTGTPGIGILTEYGNRLGIRYVWGINDTHSVYGRNGKQLKIWRVPKVYEEQIIESLENKFGYLDNKEDFIEAIKSVAVNLTEDNYSDYLDDLIQNKTNTRLDNIDNDVIEKNYKEVLKNSISYMLINRSGMDPTPYFQNTDFMNISIFQDIDSIARLGSAVSDISEMGIREIYTSLKNIRIAEIDKIRTFDKKDSLVYDDNTKANIAERSDKNGNDLQESGEISSTESYSTRGRIQDRKIWNDEVRVLKKPQEGNLRSYEDEGDFNNSLDRNRGIITNENREDSNYNEIETQYNRRNESNQSNEVGRVNEQRSESSRRNSEDGTNLQLGIYDDSDNAHYVVTDEKINRILAQAQLKISNNEIKEYFEKEKDRNKRADFIKSAYDNTYTGVLLNDKMYGYKAFENGLLFWKGNFLTKDTEILVSWEDLTDHYDSMILLHQLYDKEKILSSEKDFPELEFSQEFIDKYFQEKHTETKYEIYEQLQKGLSTAENINFLKDLYGIGGSSYTIKGSGVGVEYDSKGITLYRGYFEGREEKLLKWSHVATRIKELIKNNRYLNFQELEEYPIWLEKEKQQEELIEKEEMEASEDVSFEYNYKVGDKVYIGLDEYEIEKIDLFDIELYDPNAPLFGKTMNIVEFETKLKENPANEHLKVAKEKVEEDNYYGEYNDEVDLIEHVLYQYKVDYIDIDFDDDGNIVAIYDDTALYGKEVYDFLFDGIFDYNDDGTVNLINNKDFERLKEYCKKYEVVDNKIELTEEEKINTENQLSQMTLFVSEEQELEDNTVGEKQIDLSIGREELLPSINDDDNVEVIDNPIIIPNIEKKPKNRVINYVLHPEVPYEDRINYKITNDYLGVGTPKERYKNNIEAIKVMKKCEAEDRYATTEEQEILSKYVGWGGLSKAFQKDGDWLKEYNELKGLLTDDEFEKAMDSTLTAFYTPPIVIKSMYKALENMGLDKGNILEPSCGIGNFIGMLPNNDKLKIYGVEIDDISGKIARQLYQKSSIAIKGFEEIDYSDSFFDVAIGNVPFGDFPVLDKKYDKNHFLIHDYFFAKTIDKVRPGGVIAFITSQGTMDKESGDVRKYIAMRANLLGAIRLPNDTFKASAGTTVTTDIIFLQKRDSITDIIPDWVHLDNSEDGIKMNKYFVDNPNMILGEMKMISSQFGGLAPACLPYEDKELGELLDTAITNIHAEIEDYQLEELEEEDLSIEADLNVKNFSYTVVDDKVYYRENSRMYPQELALTTENRVKSLIEIRDCMRELINLQLDDMPDQEIEKSQEKLNNLYDNFTKKYGLINSRANASAFNGDNSYYLLCSLEILDDSGNLLRKADMFSKRTIKANKQPKKIENSNDALIVSIGERAKVDIDYMCELVHKSKEEVIKELEGIIFKLPNEDKYVTADEYLSGDIREKIKEAEQANQINPIYDINLKYLKEAKPKDLNASEISVRIGTTWIPPEDYEAFMYELFETDYYAKKKIKINYSQIRDEWYIDNKSYESYSEKVNTTYGTKRINGYKIFEETLNLKDVKIYDYFEDEVGKKKRVLNGKETAIAQAKQEQIKQAFQDWIWSDPDRRNRLEKKYNEIFNSLKPREYDGSNIIFDGINPEITLRKHQINAIARILYGGNTLLAHEVGAGKTFEMVAAAMESKRLGLCNKSLFVIPNHIVEQFASEFLQLYPSANILVATKKDFETANRKKFCSRIATGEYDAVIIGHSQFEKIPMSIERQITLLEQEVQEITEGIEESKNIGETFTVKQLMKTKRLVENKLAKLNNTERKDDNVVTFEQLGIDRLFVDEAHYYKNLYLYTKMNNVSGIAQTEAQKSSDLYMKCKYLDELTNNKGVIFATGTPISNSMVEMYTMQRYLQSNTLLKLGLQNFDAWASVFGETTTAIELAPEGTGYRSKTRFAKFYNLPELVAVFKEVADIQTADMLDLPVPKAKYENIVVKPTEIQEKMVEELAERADKIRGGNVDPHEDNMLKITNDGKKLALDQRLINELLPDDENSKVSICANNVFKFYKDYDEQKATQLVFCDLSTPKDDGTFSVYNDLRNKLIEKGVPNEEIAFIHDADNEVKKKELFSKVRKGQVRILIGSTQKMGAGTNCQDRLIAIHDLDCPWRPADLKQRAGRIVRQGNQNKEVFIFRYVTEKTFDAYLYQLIENKQKFISQIMTSKTPLRSASDVDETVLSYAEIKALAAGNPLILEKTELDAKVSKLKLLKQSHLSQIYELEDKVMKDYPRDIKLTENSISDIEEDIILLNQNKTEEFSSIEFKGITYIERKEAGNALLDIIKDSPNIDNEIEIGHYLGFKVLLGFNFLEKKFYLELKNKHSYIVEIGSDPSGNIIRIDNQLNKIPDYLEDKKIKLESLKQQFEVAKKEIHKPFPQEQELKEATKRLKEVDTALNLEEKVPDIVDDLKEVMRGSPSKSNYER